MARPRMARPGTAKRRHCSAPMDGTTAAYRYRCSPVATPTEARSSRACGLAGFPSPSFPGLFWGLGKGGHRYLALCRAARDTETEVVTLALCIYVGLDLSCIETPLAYGWRRWGGPRPTCLRAPELYMCVHTCTAPNHTALLPGRRSAAAPALAPATLGDATDAPGPDLASGHEFWVCPVRTPLRGCAHAGSGPPRDPGTLSAPWKCSR